VRPLITAGPKQSTVVLTPGRTDEGPVHLDRAFVCSRSSGSRGLKGDGTVAVDRAPRLRAPEREPELARVGAEVGLASQCRLELDREVHRRLLSLGRGVASEQGQDAAPMRKWVSTRGG
jgi:hypothetical protein